VLLIERGPLEIGAIRTAVAATFRCRGSHALPATLPPPPDHWKVDFPAMAAEAGISTPDHIAAFVLLGEFWEANSLGGT
jgi:hypothetical protein